MPKGSGNSDQKRKGAHYMHYTGLAFQLGVLLAIGAWIGRQLDAWLQTSKPYLTALSIILFLFIGFYLTLKDLLRK